MSTDLTSTKIKNTFNQLLHVDGGVTSTPKTVYDGDGTATSVKISTSGLQVNNSEVLTDADIGNSIQPYDPELIQEIQDNADSAAASATASANSATNAGISAGQASTSAANAATSATNAANSATQAANSAASAAAIVTGVASNRPSIRPSLLLDFQYTKQLDPRITFSRPTTATYYDGKTVVKAEENLLTYSQEADNVAWTKVRTSVTANTTTAPDGTATADSLIEDATASNSHYGGRQTVTLAANSTVSFSAYLKANTRTAAYVGVSSGTNATSWFAVTVDLTAGTITSAQYGAAGVYTSSTITSLGSGWYRVSVVGSVNSTDYQTRIGLSDVTTPVIGSYAQYNYSGDGASGIYLWGAQLEARSTVTAYTPTTTAPITNYIPALQTAVSNDARFDHDPVTGESKGLLIEEQRTNLWTYSEFQSGVGGVGLITASQMFGADGNYVNAAAFGRDGTTLSYLYKGTVSASTAYTISVYVKMDDGGAPSFGSASGTSVANDFYLTAGGVAPSPLTYIVTHVGNGLYRVSCSLTTTAGALGNNGLVKAATNSTRTFKTTGWQLEAGSFPTSYIPTVASQVTRSADSASMTGSNFSSWYRADEGTLYAEVMHSVPNGGADGTSVLVWATLNPSNTNYATQLQKRGNNNLSALSISSAGVDMFFGPNQTNAILPPNTTGKLAMAMKTNDFAFVTSQYQTVQTDTSVQLQQMVSMTIGGTQGTISPQQYIKRIAYYPKRLSNTELQGLTS